MSRVSHRLRSLWLHCPSQVAPLLRFGFLTSRSPCLWLKFQGVQALSLHTLLPTLTSLQRIHLSHQLQGVLKQWKKQDFIHGDLSLRNILIEPETNRLWFIDWILDLKSFQATPQYASPKVFKGIHDFSTDDFAIDKIRKEVMSINDIVFNRHCS